MCVRTNSVPARAARALAPGVFTLVGLAAVWMLLVDNESLPELLVGAGVVLIATIASELVRRQSQVSVKVRLRWLLPVWKPVVRIPLDVAVVMATIALELFGRRRQPGGLRAFRFRADGDDPESSGRRALAEAAGSTAPNTIVIGIDTRRRLILAHQLRYTSDAKSSLDPLELG